MITDLMFYLNKEEYTNDYEMIKRKIQISHQIKQLIINIDLLVVFVLNV